MVRYHMVGGSHSYDSVETGDLSYTDARENPHASNQDDLSDVTIHFANKSSTSETEFTLLNVSNGPKTMLTLQGAGPSLQTTAGNTERIGPVTIDGTTTNQWPTTSGMNYQNGPGDFNAYVPGYPVIYDSSLKVEYEHSGDGNKIWIFCAVLGSGPHTAAVVKDGEPVYSIHKNVNDDQIDDLTPPEGYSVVKNPDLSHRDPMVRGAWDAATESVVDHEYWAAFHDHLQNIRRYAERYGRQEFLDNVDTPADRGEIPVETPDWANGNSDPDPSVTSHTKEDAMAFEKQRWDDELPSSI